MKDPLHNTNEWKALAEVDLRAAELLAAEGIFALAVYHAQQCIEKVVKAALVREPTLGDFEGITIKQLGGYTLAQIGEPTLVRAHCLKQLSKRRVQIELLMPKPLRDKLFRIDRTKPDIATRYPRSSGNKQPTEYTESDANEAIELGHRATAWIAEKGW